MGTKLDYSTGSHGLQYDISHSEYAKEPFQKEAVGTIIELCHDHGAVSAAMVRD
jgi:hypothetical protein